jgi:hypothetical protein
MFSQRPAEDRGSEHGAVSLTQLVDFCFSSHTNLYGITST